MNEPADGAVSTSTTIEVEPEVTGSVAEASDPFTLLELTTRAPTIGKVLASPAPKGASGVAFRQSSLSVDSLFLGAFHVAACSMVGSGHLVNGTPRQDAYDVALTTGGDLVVSIADGMGSRTTSQVGARLFCESVTRAAAKLPDQSATDYLTAAAVQAAELAGAAYGLNADDISFVAAVAVVRVDGFEVARVGDTSVFSLDAEDGFTELFEDEGISHVNVVSASLPGDKDVQPELVTCHSGPVLVLTTDGLANDLRTSETLRAWLAACWRGPIDAYAMADSLRYHRRGSHDDRTAVVVTTPRGAPTLPSNGETEDGDAFERHETDK